MLVIIVVLAFAFDFINGFHDAANSIATIVSTKVLTPFQAVLWAAFFNVLAYAVFELHIADTIAKVVDTTHIDLYVILAGIIAAILWNLLTWYLGIPSSSSHTLVGGFAGAAIAHAGWGVVHGEKILKIGAFIFLAPLLGMVMSYIISVLLLNILRKANPYKLEKYFKKTGVKYRIVKSDDLKKTPKKDINCFWCSWNRRKNLFQTADKLGYNKIALGHHKDDIVETILMNLFFQGEISAMKPRQELFKGKIKIIRPLAYVEEDMIRRFAREENLPHDTCICPNSTVSQRARVGKIIAGLRRVCPEIKTNIFKSVQKERIRKDYLL